MQRFTLFNQFPSFFPHLLVTLQLALTEVKNLFKESEYNAQIVLQARMKLQDAFAIWQSFKDEYVPSSFKPAIQELFTSQTTTIAYRLQNMKLLSRANPNITLEVFGSRWKNLQEQLEITIEYLKELE